MPVDIADIKMVTAAKTEYQTNTMTGTMAAGKKLVIETTPAGEELISNFVVPPGKQWNYQVFVAIVETDA